jgi:glycosyltransferase involved in cell wall biosynthesis
MTRSILLVCHFYPPSTGAGVHRPVAMAKYLRRMGHGVTILTTAAYGRMPEDAGDDVVRTYDLQLLQARLRGDREATGILESDVYSNRPHPLSHVLVPEALALAWAPFAVARALRLARERRFDCVVTTSPPESAHAVGYALSRRLGVPWVADVRDGWTFESYRPPWPTRAQARLDAALERRFMTSADVVTSVAPSIVDDFRRRLGANARLVPNGWDPELAQADGHGDAAELLDPARVSVLHTGRMAVVGRDPAPLVHALTELAHDEPALAARVELAFAGSLTPGERELIDSVPAPAKATALGNLPRARALALQRAADVLLVLTSGTRVQEVTGKLFEYLATGHPVVALADAHANDAGRIVRETGGGIVVPNTLDAAREALRRIAAGELPAPAPNAVAAYSYPGVAERMADAIEAAIARHEG